MNKNEEIKDSQSQLPHNIQRRDSNSTNRVAVTAQITIPPDGGWGWVVMLASFFIFAVGDGTVFTFGSSIYSEISTDLDLTPAFVSLINSITVSCSFIFGPVVTAIINRYGFRICAMVGSAITSSCCFLTFFFGNYASLILFYGLIAGLGFSMLNMPALLVIGFYFQRLRGVAFPIAIGGSSVGIVTLSLLYAHLAHIVGWRYTVLFQASLIGFAYFVAMAYRPLLSMTVVVATDDDDEISASDAVLSSIELRSGHGWGRSGEDEGIPHFKSNQNFPTAAQMLSDMAIASTMASTGLGSPRRTSLIAMIPLNKHAEYHEHELERVRSMLDQIEEENEEYEEEKGLKNRDQEVEFDQIVEKGEDEKKDKQKGEVGQAPKISLDTKKNILETEVEKDNKKDDQEGKDGKNMREDKQKNDEETQVDKAAEKGKDEQVAKVSQNIGEEEDNKEAKVDQASITEDDEKNIPRTSRDNKVDFRMKNDVTEEPQTTDVIKSKDDRRVSIVLDGSRTKSLQLDGSRTKSLLLDGTRTKSILLRRSRIQSTTLLDGARSKSVILDRRKSRGESMFFDSTRSSALLNRKSRRSSIFKDILHWEEHVPEARPMYRDDAFLDTTERVLTSTHEVVEENPIEYQLKMSRVVAADDLKQRKGMFTTAFTRVLFTMLDPSFLKRKSCLCVCLSMLLFYSAYLVPIIFLTDRGRYFGIPHEFRRWFLTSVGLSAILGRFIGSLIALRAHPLHILFGMYTVAGVATILSIFGRTFVLQVMYCTIFGMTTAGTNSMRTAIFARLYGLENLTNCTGMAYLFQGVGCLVSPPFAGALKGLWEQAPFIYSGFCFIISALLFLPVLSLVEKEKREAALRRFH